MPPKKSRRTSSKVFSEKYSLNTYIKKFFGEISGSFSETKTRISGDAVSVVNELNFYVFFKITKAASMLMSLKNVKTCGLKEIISAVELVIPGQLAYLAKKEIMQTVNKVANVKVEKQKKSGLVFPIARAKNMLREKLSGCSRVSPDAAMAVAVVLEFMTGETLELAINSARGRIKGTVSTYDIVAAIQDDVELKPLFSEVEINGIADKDIDMMFLPKK